jgi:hypothetical protein
MVGLPARAVRKQILGGEWTGRSLCEWRDGGAGSKKHTRVFPTKRVWDGEIRRRKRGGMTAKTLTGREEVWDLLQAWWQRESPRGRPATRRIRASMFRTWVDGYIGGKPIRKMTTET